MLPYHITAVPVGFFSFTTKSFYQDWYIYQHQCLKISCLYKREKEFGVVYLSISISMYIVMLISKSMVEPTTLTELSSHYLVFS